MIFWFLTPCSVVCQCEYVRRTCCLHSPGQGDVPSIQRASRAKNRNPNSRRRENQSPHKNKHFYRVQRQSNAMSCLADISETCQDHHNTLSLETTNENSLRIGAKLLWLLEKWKLHSREFY